MKEIYTSCYSSRHVIPILSYRIVNLLCCVNHFSNITSIDAQAKYRSPYLFWGHPSISSELTFVKWVVHIWT